MGVYSCPKGHSSSEEDFCSECGAKIATSNGSASAPMECPDCKAPRGHDAGEFCEVCGYNFRTGAHGDVAFAQAVVEEIPAAETPAPASRWFITASIDPTLREEGS